MEDDMALFPKVLVKGYMLQNTTTKQESLYAVFDNGEVFTVTVAMPNDDFDTDSRVWFPATLSASQVAECFEYIGHYAAPRHRH
jgi:hypothetical protein